VNAIEATTYEATPNAALAGAPDPASKIVQAANTTKDLTYTTPSRHWSQGRVHIYYYKEAIRRRTPGTGALYKIRHYQRDGGLIGQKIPFQWLCRENLDTIVFDDRDSNIQIPRRFQTSASMVLQEA
jgi:hypothetical protein